jgi:hypothetical protein
VLLLLGAERRKGKKGSATAIATTDVRSRTDSWY